MINSSSMLVISPELAMCELDGGAALINLASGSYFKLNGTAAKFCSLIEAPKTFAAVLEDMHAIYDVGKDILEPELIALVEAMSAQGLLSITD